MEIPNNKNLINYPQTADFHNEKEAEVAGAEAQIDMSTEEWQASKVGLRWEIIKSRNNIYSIKRINPDNKIVNESFEESLKKVLEDFRKEKNLEIDNDVWTKSDNLGKIKLINLAQVKI